jgi:hypothetical protein
MSEFIDALKKTNPDMFASEQSQGTGVMIDMDKGPQQAGGSMSFQDMKDYFDAMKKSLTDDVKKEMLEIVQQMKQESNTDNGDTNNTQEENKEE